MSKRKKKCVSPSELARRRAQSEQDRGVWRPGGGVVFTPAKRGYRLEQE